MMREESSELTERLLNQSKGSEFDATYQVLFYSLEFLRAHVGALLNRRGVEFERIFF